MNNQSNFTSTISISAQDGFGLDTIHSDVPHDFTSSKPVRIILTKNQFDTYIGCLTDITSKKGKAIAEQTKKYKLMQWLLKDICKRSNGGAVSIGINQLNLRKQKLPNGSPINAVTLSEVIRNLEYHKIIVKVGTYKVGQNSNMFILGDIVMDLLDPIKLNYKSANKAWSKNKERLLLNGLDPDLNKICPCCKTVKFNTSFGIYFDNENEAIVETKPICMECEKSKKRTGIKPNGWDAAWSNFYLSIRNMVNVYEILPEQIKEL